MTLPSDSGPDRFLRWLLERRTRLVLAWFVAFQATLIASALAWFNCRDAKRVDGNWGHQNIDFSGQWLLAALFVSGEGRHLYDRLYQEPLLEKAYPRDLENPEQEKPDSEVILGWLTCSKDKDSSLCGPLYPPVHALLFAPLGLLPPQPAYRVMQTINLALTILCAWLIERLTHGRIWMPVVVMLLFLYPGHAGGFHLGQNPIVSLTLLLLGWILLRDGRDLSGGMVWGLLVYKPVWVVAFLLVPLLMRRWRFAAGMVGSAAVLILATLPFTGLNPWLDWLELGNLASEQYGEMQNWIFLSRDLIGIPRRYLLNFEDRWVTKDANRRLPTILGTLLWISVPLTTGLIVLLKRRKPAPLEGPGAAFILLGAYFSCYHFMYYDVFLTVLPITLLFTRPDWFHQRKLPLILLVLLVLLAAPPIAAWLVPTHFYPPFDTFALLALWALCGEAALHE